MKKFLRLDFILGLVLTVIAFLVGAPGSVMMADAATAVTSATTSGEAEGKTTEKLPDAGVSNSGNGGESPNGIATETQGKEDADPEMYKKYVDSLITKIKPMRTPIDQISRKAKSVNVQSAIVKYYSVGTRPIKTTLKTAVTLQTDNSTIALDVSDQSMFTVDDTIQVVGTKGYKEDGKTVTTQNLVLCVCGRDATSNKPIVFAVNGLLGGDGQTTVIPAIPASSVLIRMGKACGELDVQTGKFNNLPTSQEQYVQNFMIQVEQSTFDKLASKEVNWNFSDIEEDAVFDMKLTEEASYLFGVKRLIKHVTKNNMAQYFTGGIWWMAGKDIEVGTYDTASKTTVISDDNLVDITKDLFVGNDAGNGRKVMFCGSDMLAALSKIQSTKFRLKGDVKVWDLEFTSFKTDFGEILCIYHDLLDQMGRADEAFALDPEYLTKAIRVSWTRNVLDLKKAGIRNTDAAVIQEVAGLYLRYPQAHARLKLAAAA